MVRMDKISSNVRLTNKFDMQNIHEWQLGFTVVGTTPLIGGNGDEPYTWTFDWFPHR
jgi:hypothetical protein